MKKIAILISFTFLTTYGQDLSQNLLLNYKFDGNTLDDSPNSYDGTNYGATFGNDRFDNPNSALYFDGIDDYMEFPNLLALKPTLPVSFSFWINYDNTNYEDCEVFTTSYEDDVNSGVYFNSQIATGNYAVNFANGSNFYNSTARRSLVTTEAIVPNQWHHIVVTVSSYTNMKIYVDCAKFTGTFSGTGSTLVYSSTPGCIGRRDRDLNTPPNYFKGAIDDFMYWDKELNLDEISMLCNNTYSTDLVNENITYNLQVYYYRNMEYIQVVTSNEIQSYDIYDFSGKKILNHAYTPEISTKNLSKGFYIICFYATSGSVITKKILID